MAGIVTGASAMREAVKPKERLTSFDFFKLDDGKSVMVRFLQEIDDQSEHYVEDNGLGFLAYVINPPTADGWKYRFFVDEDNEHLLEDIGDWPKKGRLFISMLVNRGNDADPEWKLELWDASKAVLRQLLEWSDDLGGITHKNFKVTRSGTGTSTTYILMPKNDVPDDYNAADHEVVDAQARLLTRLTPEDVARFNKTDESTDDNVEWLT